MLSGLVLGLVSWLSLYLTWLNAPMWIRRWTLRHTFISEGISTVSTWLFLTAISKTLVAVIASAIAGLMVNFTLLFYEKVGWLHGK